MTRVLLIDDDTRFAEDLTLLLGDAVDLATVSRGADGLAQLLDDHPDVVLLDLDLGPGQPDGLELLAEIRMRPDPPPVIMLTGSRDHGDTVRCIKAGAYHYCTKPPNPLELLHLIDLARDQQSSAARLRAMQDEAHARRGQLEFADPRMAVVVRELEQVAPMPSTVLITGPSGTGKEVIARRIHQLSQCSQGPFVAVNCAAVPRELAESKFFGHEKGAFTGAESLQRGVFEQANGGTLFLDEVGDAPADLHAKLLRALQEEAICRVGNTREIKVKVRVLAATSRDLEAEVAAGRFREELYFRLNVFRLKVPALDDRPRDIAHLARHFLKHFARTFGRPITGLSDDAIAYLEGRSWRGNVRELRNTIERGVIRCEGETLHAAHLSYAGDMVDAVPPPWDEARERLLRVFLRQYATTQFRNAEGNVTRAAEASGVARQTFSSWVKDLGLDVSEA